MIKQGVPKAKNITRHCEPARAKQSLSTQREIASSTTTLLATLAPGASAGVTESYVFDIRLKTQFAS